MESSVVSSLPDYTSTPTLVSTELDYELWNILADFVDPPLVWKDNVGAVPPAQKYSGKYAVEVTKYLVNIRTKNDNRSARKPDLNEKTWP